ncbi:MAG: hypothetical protein JKX68_03150 [Flavobacteriales bacterium]|nr:hypothetical protein [Flavobacteriales bacterium]
MKVGIEVFQNESGREGLDFIIKTGKGNFHELYLQSLNFEKEGSIRISKEDLKEPKDNLWIAFVLVMKNMDCSLYLIPSTVLLKPEKHSFLGKNQGEKPHWEIKVFIEAIPELSKFAIANIASQL